MKKFSLSAKNKAFPDAWTANGSAFPFNTDFRRILRILRLMDDPEVLEKDKAKIAAHLFFKNKTPPDPLNALKWFITCGEDREGGGDKDFDYEQDAREIYSAFMQVYGVDLMEADMHFWKFSMLLDGLFSCPNALSNKVQLRHVDDSKGKRKADLERAKRNVAVGYSVSAADANLENKIRERLREGKPINDLLGGVDLG